MTADRWQFVLGSRSPRRRELLTQLVSSDTITVLPPLCADEAGFESLHTDEAIVKHLQAIAAEKGCDVWQQTQAADLASPYVVIAADTVIVATDSAGTPIVLGQPPDDDSWQTTVEHWFREYFVGRTHRAKTAIWLKTSAGDLHRRVVVSEVTFSADADRWLAWYLQTGESRGKAGGYAIQGSGSLFVSRVDGSLSNVIGLPIKELLEAFAILGIDV